MSEISSGLVAVAWVPDDAIAKLREQLAGLAAELEK